MFQIKKRISKEGGVALLCHNTMVFCFADSRRDNGQSMTTHLAISSVFGNWAPLKEVQRKRRKRCKENVSIAEKNFEKTRPCPHTRRSVVSWPFYPPLFMRIQNLLCSWQLPSLLRLGTILPSLFIQNFRFFLLSEWIETQPISNLMFSTRY